MAGASLAHRLLRVTLRLISLVMIVATWAAMVVWLLTVMTSGPVAYVETRNPCSAGMFIGNRDPEATWPPHCRQAPIPAVARYPSPTAAVATFMIVGTLGLVAAQRSRRRE